EVVSASIFFGTDAPLYLATAAMLYYLFVLWSDSSEHFGTWIGLGLAIGLGLLSKASFIPIALPVLVFSWAVSLRRNPGFSSLLPMLKAGALALLVAGPWWVLNLKAAMVMTQQARVFVRNSLGPPSLMTWILWFSTVLQGLLGHGLSILIGLVVIAWLRKAIIKKQTIINPPQRTALWAC